MAFPTITWTARTPPAGYVWINVIWIEALSRYIAVGYKASTLEGAVAYSPTGVTWIVFTADEVLAHQWYDVAYHAGTGRIVVVGAGKPTGDPLNPDDKCITSDDAGGTWDVHDIDNALHGASDSVDWGSVVALPSGRLVVGALITYNDDQPFSAYSDDGGDNWTTTTPPSPYDPAGTHTLGTLWGRLAAKTDGSRIVIPNNDSDSGVAYSDDEGETWSLGTMPASSGDAYGSAAAWSPDLGVFGIAGTESSHRSSAWTGNGASWTNRFRSDVFDLPSTLSGAIAWIGADTPFFLVAGNPTSPPDDTSYVRASEDGATWFDSVDPATTGVAPWMGIAYSSSLARIVMVSASGDIVTGDLPAPETPPDESGTGPVGEITDVFADFLLTGNGLLNYRLMIEGWPEEFVTDDWITHATNKNGRAVYPGLQRQGLRRASRVIMQDGKVQAEGNTFRIVPVDGFERTVESLANYPTASAMLDDSLTPSGTEITLRGGGSLTSGTVYHLGTEALRAGDDGAITRHIWDTLSQSHHTTVRDQSRAVYIYPRPPTMENRRVYLFAYGEGDDGAGDGTLIWRGRVSKPPRLERDGVSWSIDCGPVTDAFREQIAGGLQELHPFGIYHHWQCPFVVQIIYDGTIGDVYQYCGIDDDELSFIKNANALIETARAAMGIAEIDPKGLVLNRLENEPWTLNVTPNADMPDLSIGIGSPIIGTVVTSTQRWTNASTSKKREGFGLQPLQSGQKYYCELSRANYDAADGSFQRPDDGYSYDGAPVSPLGHAAQLMNPIKNSAATPGVSGTLFIKDSARSAFPDNRIYVDGDPTGMEAAAISDTFSPTGYYPVSATGVDGDGRHYIEVDLFIATAIPKGTVKANWNNAYLATRGFDGWLNSGTTINALIQYAQAGSVTDFIAGLKFTSPDANDGDVPFLTAADVTPWALSGNVSSPLQTERSYSFIHERDLETILAEECKVAGHFPRLEFDGRIGLKNPPDGSDAVVVADDHIFDDEVIITPGGGGGAWPGWVAQRDGLVNVVDYKEGYDPRSDDWNIKLPPFTDPDSIATHKGRGKNTMSIAPYSTAPSLPAGTDLEVFEEIAIPYLSMFSQDYADVTLKVPFTRFNVLNGDAVLLTHVLIMNGNGTRGVEQRAGIVVQDEWNLDPAVGDAPGMLTIRISLAPQLGYAPSAGIDAHVDNGGNNWTLTCPSDTDQANIEWSTNADGAVLEHFHAGDFIEVLQWDDDTPTRVAGVVVGEPDLDAETIVVQLASTWTPGSGAWTLEVRQDSDGAHSTASQRAAIAYVAGADGRTPAGGFGVKLL